MKNFFVMVIIYYSITFCAVNPVKDDSVALHTKMNLLSSIVDDNRGKIIWNDNILLDVNDCRFSFVPTYDGYLIIIENEIGNNAIGSQKILYQNSTGVLFDILTCTSYIRADGYIVFENDIYLVLSGGSQGCERFEISRIDTENGYLEDVITISKKYLDESIIMECFSSITLEEAWNLMKRYTRVNTQSISYC